MTNTEQREAARQFFYKWKDRGYEKGDMQSFWIDLLTAVLGEKDAVNNICFEKKVVINGNTKYIDAYIPETKVLIEQKSSDIDLDKKQAGHDGKTPYEQAFEYNTYLPADEKASWLITCNFKEIRIYDMNKIGEAPIVIWLNDLQTDCKYLDFLVKEEVKEVSKEVKVSKDAGKIVGMIYDALYKQYENPDLEKAQKSLNVLCVRLVFCLYAEDAGLFGSYNKFYNYMSQFPAKKWHDEIINLFKILDTPFEERDPYIDDELKEFPYVNGGLFQQEDIEIPKFTDEICTLILEKGSKTFDWSEISPTIFGAVFESTLNAKRRREGGMHYTSIENIHKVIDPLFLDDLKIEYENIISRPLGDSWRTRYLKAFHEKIGNLCFYDPACGSGNFLTESYISLRKLENQILYELSQIDENQMVLDFLMV